MSRQTGSVAFFLGIAITGILLLAQTATAARTFYSLPPRPASHAFGNVMIDRVSTDAGVKPVVFSHWVHRMGYTCTVCHTELEFDMAAGSTEITMEAIGQGRFCGACHDGQNAFAPAGNCARCHDTNPDARAELFEAVFNSRPFPTAPFGNGIDWVKALRRGLIEPAPYLKVKIEEMPFDRELLLQAEMGNIPPAVFPHKAHSEWMDCDTCHPAIFNIKAKTTKHFRMALILKGQFCGACHLNVAFPMDDCARCHPGIEE